MARFCKERDSASLKHSPRDDIHSLKEQFHSYIYRYYFFFFQLTRYSYTESPGISTNLQKLKYVNKYAKTLKKQENFLHLGYNRGVLNRGVLYSQRECKSKEKNNDIQLAKPIINTQSKNQISEEETKRQREQNRRERKRVSQIRNIEKRDEQKKGRQKLI